MIRVLRIVNRFNLGGPIYNVTNLTKYLPADFETKLIGGLKEEAEEDSRFILEKAGVDYEVIPEMKRSVSPASDLKSLQRIRAIIRGYRPHIVHTHAAKAGMLGRIAAHKEKVPVIVHTFHGHVFEGYFNPRRSAIYQAIERRLASRSDAIVCLSNTQLYDITEKFKICRPEKCHVIPLGFELEKFGLDSIERREKFRALHGLEEDELAIGIIGRLTAVKDHDLFLEVLAELVKAKLKFRAFIIGGGEERERLENKCLEWGSVLGQGLPVHFTSWIKNIDEILPGLDVVVLTSKNEGTPVSLIEAQSAGIPVVSTRVGGVADVVCHGKTGFVVERDAHACAQAIAKLTDPSLRAQFGTAGKLWANEHFSYKRLVSDTTALYQQLLKSAT